MGKTDKFLQLELELKPYIKVMGQASDVIVDENVSNYPIMVVHQQEVSIGIPVIEAEKYGGIWSINASTLEEFVSKSIIFEDKINDFRATYKDPVSYLCIFVLSELGAKFVFIPR